MDYLILGIMCFILGGFVSTVCISLCVAAKKSDELEIDFSQRILSQGDEYDHK